MASAGRAAPAISVVIPVRNEEKHLGQVLEDLSHQTLAKDRFEIIVVDGLSRDRTPEVAREYTAIFPMFQIRENPRQLSSAARNIGFLASQGDYILFIDGHCRIASERMLADVLDLFDRHDVEILCRPQPLTAEPMTTFQRAVATARASKLGHGLDSIIYDGYEGATPAASAGAIYRRSVFATLGSYDESFDACEDVEFNTRADRTGLRAYSSPRLTVKYFARENIPALWRQLFRYGIGRWQLMVKHPVSASPGTFVPPLLALSVPLLLFWWLLFPPLGIVMTALLALYLVVVLIASAVIAVRQGVALAPRLPLIFLTIHLALGFGFLLGPILSLRR